MPLPPEPILRGARRWIEHLPSQGTRRARALLTSAREYADLTPTQYAESLTWIHTAGLLDESGALAPPDLSPARLLETIITSVSPSWLPDADLLVRESAEIPDDVLTAAAVFDITPDEALVSIRNAWAKVDTALRKRIGDAGETEILRLLDLAPGARADHVASWSDAHGYDIAVTGLGYSCHLEVKATTRTNRLTIYLSRNEYEVMTRDPQWVLVIVVLDARLTASRILQVPTRWLADHAPVDTALGGRWESARFGVPATACLPGVHPLLPLLNETASSLLTGGIPSSPLLEAGR